MAKYGTFKYEEEKFGVGITTGNLLWNLRVLWDGVWWGPNEAHGRMLDLTVERGRQSIMASGGSGLESFAPGEVTAVLDNSDGRFDPFNVDSDLFPNVRPGKFIRLEVTDDSTDTTYSIMRGIIDDIQPVGVTDQVRIKIVDGLQWLKDRVINLGQQQDIAKHSPFDLIIGYDGIAGKVDWPVDEWPISRTTDTDTQDFWWAWNQVAYKAMEEWNKAEWAVAFHDRHGNITWRPRSYSQERTINIAQDEILTSIERPQPWEVVRNIVRVTSSPKILDVVGAILWQLQTVPALADGETFYIEPLFHYSSWLPCGANVVFSHTVNAEAGGGGADLTGDCDLVYDTQIGEGARLWLTNNSGSDGYIIEFKATGDAIYPPSVDFREEEDAVSKAAYGGRSLTIDNRWIEDTEFAQTQAAWLLDNLKEPSMLPTIQMEDQLVNQFTPDLYDKLILRVPKIQLRQVFRVGHIEHQWLTENAENGQSVRSEMRLEPYLLDGVDMSNDAFLGCLLSNSTPTPIADATTTLLSWDTNLIESAYHTAGSTIVIPAGLTGYYRIFGSIQWEGNTVKKRILRLYNGAAGFNELALTQSDGLGTTSYTQHTEVTYYLEAGDLIRCYVYQNSGGNLDVEHDSTPYSPLFGVEFLGA